MSTPAQMHLQVEPGYLWPRIVATSVSALKTGALHSIATTYEHLEQEGMPFLVRTLTNLARKDAAGVQKNPVRSASNVPANPFLPPEPDLVVAEISATHLCVLNKFNVVDHHCLLITREFESQDAALTLADFTALATCLFEFEGLGFYNGGRLAGASQPHKHIQVVPLPFLPNGDRIPLEAVFSYAHPHEQDAQLERILLLPFQHGLIRWRSLSSSTSEVALQFFQAYQQLIQTLRLGNLASSPAPYNLLVTREWMFVVPRSQEAFQSIAVNALGFAGALLVRNAEQLEFVQQVGPLRILTEVAHPI